MKNYLVVGASSGIGKALAQRLVSAGNQVYATYCKNPPQDNDSPGLQHHYLDVREAQLALDFLPERLDGFAFCPGSINLLPFGRIKAESFVEDFQLQVVGAVKVLQLILPKLKAVPAASILFFSTVAVQQGFSFHTLVAASKGALEGLTRSLAAELAPNIRVNAIAPSITNTPLAARFLATEEKMAANIQRHPLRKIGSPTDMAEAAAFLLSDQSSWITGQILHIDGGISSVRS